MSQESGITNPASEIPVLLLHNVRKDYRGLRPLRIQRLELREGQSLALLGFDRITAEVFVNLATGAIAPDSGEVHVFGQSTAAIVDGDAWLASLDRFGILTDRAVLLDQLTVAQNLAVPFSLELNPIPEPVQCDVNRLAAEVGLDASHLSRTVVEIEPPTRLRVRLARAVALNPRVLLSEHPTASLAADEVPAFAADLTRVMAARRLASVTLTADPTFASAVAQQVMTLQPATGELKSAAGWRRWFGRG